MRGGSGRRTGYPWKFSKEKTEPTAKSWFDRDDGFLRNKKDKPIPAVKQKKILRKKNFR